MQLAFITRSNYSPKFPHLHQSTAASTWWCGPRPRLGWVEMAVGLPRDPSYPGHFPSFFRYCMLPPERPQKGSTQLLQNRSPVFFFSFLLPFSCRSSSPYSPPSLGEQQRSSQPWPHLSQLCVRWKCDLARQVSVMLHLLQMGSAKMLTTFPLRIQSSRQLSLFELPPAVSPLVTR